MRILGVTTMAVLVGASGWAGENRTPVEPSVTVCMALDSPSFVAAYQAQAIATKMFADIGVQVEWRTNRHSCAANGAILIKLTEDTPRSYIPRAFAFALPYEGVHIQVFYDRLKEAVTPPDVPCLLAHVLVHEITHILEGIDRHSESGVMKAHWSNEDFNAMRCKPLAFADEDVHLIHFGWKKRVVRLASVDLTASAVARQ
jgi:hypothetical protein